MQVSPVLLLKEIPDLYARTNFKNLQDYFRNQNQLLDFKFIEVIFDEATESLPINHGLKFIPKDIIQTHISGTGVVTFKYAEFDTTYLYASSTGPARIRFYVGTYFSDKSTEGFEPTDTSEWSATLTSSSSATTSNDTIKTIEKDYTVIDSDTTLLLAGLNNVSITVTLPSASTEGRRLKVIKSENTFTQHTILAIDNQTIGGASNTKVSTYQESVDLVAIAGNWVVEKRYYPSNWSSYTPVGSFTTNVTYTGKYKRIGDSILLDINAALTGVPSGGGGNWELGIPSGLTIDTSKISSIANTVRPLLGNGIAEDISTTTHDIIIPNYLSTTKFNVYYDTGAGATALATAISPFAFDTGDYVNMKLGAIPITGWEG